MKTIVYTALVGPKSVVQPSDWTGPDIDYLCWTDQHGPLPEPWRHMPLERTVADPAREAKRFKVLPHWYLPPHEINIWVDANMRITRGFSEMIETLQGETEMTLFRHFERDCLYDEAEVCKAMGLDDPALIDRQMARYRACGFPAHYGLAECGVMVRRDTPDIRRLNEHWWAEICLGSRRDQLSFMWSVWHLTIRGRVRISDRTGRDGYHHTWTPHLNMGPLIKT